MPTTLVEVERLGRELADARQGVAQAMNDVALARQREQEAHDRARNALDAFYAACQQFIPRPATEVAVVRHVNPTKDHVGGEPCDIRDHKETANVG